MSRLVDIDISSKKEGVFYDMDIEEYHNHEGLSSTQFNDLDLSVAIYENRHLFKYESEAFNVGNLNHTALLEPHLLEDKYIETTTTTFNTLETKKMIKSYASKKIVVPKGSIDLAKDRASKVLIVYKDEVNMSLKEVSFIVYDENIGIYRKARADMWLPQHGIVLDYKTSKETRPESFRKKSIPTYNYDLSAAWYMDTINLAIDKFNLKYPKITQFGWIISPNYEPYKTYGGSAGASIIEKGRAKYTQLLDKYIEVKFRKGRDEKFKSWQIEEY